MHAALYIFRYRVYNMLFFECMYIFQCRHDIGWEITNAEQSRNHSFIHGNDITVYVTPPYEACCVGSPILRILK